MANKPKMKIKSAPPMAPLGMAIVAAEALAAGKDIDGAAAAVVAAVEKDPSLAEGSPYRPSGNDKPASGPAEKEISEAELAAHFQRKYLLGFLRLSNGRFDGLSLEELYEAAQCSTVQTVDFETWCKRVGVKD